MEENENQQVIQPQGTVAPNKKNRLAILLLVLLGVSLILVLFWAGYFIGNYNVQKKRSFFWDSPILPIL